MADSRTAEGLLLSGQWGDSEQRQEVGSDDRSPGPGSQVDQEHGEGEQSDSYQGKHQIIHFHFLQNFESENYVKGNICTNN